MVQLILRLTKLKASTEINLKLIDARFQTLITKGLFSL